MIPPCLTLSNIRHVLRVKWSNPGKGVAPSPTPRCSSYLKGSLLCRPRQRSPTLLFFWLAIRRDSVSLSLQPCPNLFVWDFACLSLEISIQLFFIPFLFSTCCSVYPYALCSVFGHYNKSFFALFYVLLLFYHYYFFHFTLSREFHTSVCWWFLTGVSSGLQNSS